MTYGRYMAQIVNKRTRKPGDFMSTNDAGVVKAWKLGVETGLRLSGLKDDYEVVLKDFQEFAVKF
jgi:hypothetical protein